MQSRHIRTRHASSDRWRLSVAVGHSSRSIPLFRTCRDCGTAGKIAHARGSDFVILQAPFGHLSTKGSPKMTSVLFSPITLRGLTLPNRVVVSPMCQYNSDNGSANDWHLMHLGSFSLGAAGLVMCEMTDVTPRGRITPKCAGMWSDENEAALKRVHDFCRTYGVAKLGVQLAHAGRKGSTQTPAQGGKPLAPDQAGWVRSGERRVG